MKLRYRKKITVENLCQSSATGEKWNQNSRTSFNLKKNLIGQKDLKNVITGYKRLDKDLRFCKVNRIAADLESKFLLLGSSIKD